MESIVKPKNDIMAQKRIKKDCERAFNDGDPPLYTALKYKIDKNTVYKYYKIFRLDEAANMDKEFISEQKYHKAHAMKALRNRMIILEEQLERIIKQRDSMGEEGTENREITSCEAQLTRSLIALSDLEQQMHALGMSRTVDISLRKLAEDRNVESGNKESK